MRHRLGKRDREILDNLDRLLAGQAVQPSKSFLEDKIFQAFQRLEVADARREQQQQETTRLLSDLSHQLKTPLAALSLHLELGEDEALTASERAAALEECRAQAEKIRFLTEAMLKVSRLESGLIAVKKQPADLVHTLQQAVQALSPAARAKGLSLTVSCPPTCLVPHDPVWTKEALVNVLDNGVKYTAQGGLDVRLEQGPLFTRIDIADTGPGLPPQDYPRVFGRFYRGTTGRVPGTGLGLSIAREILRQQGGNITVESPGKGCVFTLFLQNC